ncbi:uncharacterized protein F4822DRAFT_388865 [Hypoxylon trugodes]|uniref:uncharacterized protein n=1 Tax=Hypoxylon trugodes TaxID=326681 RepID=UPI0021960DB7|nr:uncharacterized protein F4822DRAFT_388865 [Hypoxylon trugodes]KAI1391908.1 hypothetical protein F4822DRAFT_388865 [Hypoxylon trugodes]
MASLNDLHTTLETTLKAFFNDYTVALREKDVTRISASLTPDCKRLLKPAYFPVAYPFVKAEESNAEYEARMKGELSIMESTSAEIHEITIDPIKRKGSAYVTHINKLRGKDTGNIDICWYFDFSDDGKKISRIVEFIDTAVSEKMIEDMRKQGVFPSA